MTKYAEKYPFVIARDKNGSGHFAVMELDPRFADDGGYHIMTFDTLAEAEADAAQRNAEPAGVIYDWEVIPETGASLIESIHVKTLRGRDGEPLGVNL